METNESVGDEERAADALRPTLRIDQALARPLAPDYGDIAGVVALQGDKRPGWGKVPDMEVPFQAGAHSPSLPVFRSLGTQARS